MIEYSQKIIINNKEINLADILSGKVSSFSAFENSTFSFIKEWLEGQDSFNLHTSGSTGNPKEITLTRNQLRQSAQRTLKALSLDQNDTALVCLDTKYIAGKMMLVRALEGNMKIAAADPSANPLQNIQGPVTFTALVPLQLQEILKHPNSIQKLNEMKAVIIGGAAVNTFLQKEITKLKCAVYATYGMTETVSHIALQCLNGRNASNHFTALPGIKIKTDNRGCLVIQMPEFSEPIITNDLVEIISRDQFRWLGRYDNVINSGGFKISPEKIEKELEAILPDRAFFVTSILDERLGEKLVLIMEGSARPVDFKTLQLHPYEVPKDIILLPEFVRTETGKINREKTMRLLRIG
ncbi:MAG TPA: AMP-binding protein [Cyclobacteriaceae bacterium]|nr:AMP-binding protein [Cyclobacteriaceae bacterium]